MRVLSWHVHGAWSTAFVQGGHDYLVPVVPDRGPGRPRPGPDVPLAGHGASRSPRERLATEPVDVVVLQRPRDLELADAWLGGRRVGRDVPGGVRRARLPARRACRTPGTRWPTGTTCRSCTSPTSTQLMWDSGRAPSTVIEHGVVDPGPLWTGELPRAGVVVNDAGPPRPAGRRRPAAGASPRPPRWTCSA